MKKRLLLAACTLTLVVGAIVALKPAETADKLPKCSGQLCQKSGCSADTLCARGAAVVTCAEVCGGH
ncbi:MAG TPA: hypothetical protein VFD06_09850 [Candidatus Polarisedimenticolia bacterium]|nr:hypothetical protein [Candidatus Polarisedimenticolia bacterium]